MEPGTLIDERYEIVSTLGQGGMGAVYLAEDTKLGTRVALKIAEASGAAYDEFAQRFKREAKIGNKLGRETGLVRAFDWGKLGDGRSLFLAMDLVADATPLDLSADDLGDRLAALKAAAELVAKVHAHRVVHRDLKPENFLQDPTGAVYLTDFGLAKNLDAKTGHTTAMLTKSQIGMGSPYYMPPEQFEDAASVDTRADIYALGVMLFAALTQHFPYGGDTPAEVFKKQVKVQVGSAKAPAPRDLVPDVDAGLNDLCTRAMSLEAKDRDLTAEDFAAALAPHAAKRAPQRPATGSSPRGAAKTPTPKPDDVPRVELERLLDLAKGMVDYATRLDAVALNLVVPTFGLAVPVGLITEWYWGLLVLVVTFPLVIWFRFVPKQRALSRNLGVRFLELLAAHPQLGTLPPSDILPWVAGLQDPILQETIAAGLRRRATARS